ncbi:MAG TPA: signal peptide peptidase SppA [Candidatus Sulfotelmatobacter sp.]|nr:signal peptide peptidase SppA [Candidatus Sulfotelmatobacter sp.]
MLAYLLYGLRLLVRAPGNLVRRLRRPPEYVVFTLEGPYRPLRPPRAPFWQRVVTPTVNSLQDLADQVRTVRDEPRVKGVVLHLRNLQLSPSRELAHLQTIRDLVEDLKGAGKRVIAWSTGYDTARYFVASAAHEVLLQPGGLISPLGVAQSYLFLKDALARVGLEGDFLQVSPYKSAMDVLVRREMSPEHREMVTWLVEAAHGELARAIAAGRNISEADARALMDHSPYTDTAAKQARVVDGVMGEEDLPAYLGQARRPARLALWEVAQRRVRRRPLPRPGRFIALIRIEGEIVDGSSQRPPFHPPVPIPFLATERTGDLSVVQAARATTAMRRAAAVVVAIDSPGGSASASEAIAAALENVATRKPLVVSMGGLAGSGGYYVSLPARWIMAQPGTLTGSIGVIMGKLVNARLLDVVGAHREAVSRGLHIEMEEAAKPYTDEERALVRKGMLRIYEVFKERVMKARRLSADRLEPIAGGRVFTGRQARENGLVDELGGLNAAIRRACEFAGLDEGAPVREIAVRQRRLAPIPQPAGALEYALQGLAMLDGATPLCLMPIA